MGIEIGTRLKEKQAIDPIDVLIPVPIHPKKAFDRGYNQSEWIAKGIASVIPAEIQKNWMVKNHHTKSQTRSNRFNRWDNVSTNFSSRIIDTFEGHIAIVDDVITTGATIEAMVSAIQAKNKKVKISVITLAITK
jgi:predicted amidophosphoribosyltransferase